MTQPIAQNIPKCPSCGDSQFASASGAPTGVDDEMICQKCGTHVAYLWWLRIVDPDAVEKAKKTVAEIAERIQQKP